MPFYTSLSGVWGGGEEVKIQQNDIKRLFVPKYIMKRRQKMKRQNENITYFSPQNNEMTTHYKMSKSATIPSHYDPEHTPSSCRPNATRRQKKLAGNHVTHFIQ